MAHIKGTQPLNRSSCCFRCLSKPENGKIECLCTKDVFTQIGAQGYTSNLNVGGGGEQPFKCIVETLANHDCLVGVTYQIWLLRAKLGALSARWYAFNFTGSQSERVHIVQNSA